MSARTYCGKFPIGAWVAPPPARGGRPGRITPERYAEIAECGINCIYALYDVLPECAEEVENALRCAERAGIGYLARFTDLTTLPAGERADWLDRAAGASLVSGDSGAGRAGSKAVCRTRRAQGGDGVGRL